MNRVFFGFKAKNIIDCQIDDLTVILNGNDLARLGDAMEQQEFREGIPAGVGSAVVWDKVGFLDQYLHDAAVVKSDKGEMILVILTAGGSWETIAEAAYAVYDSY